MSIFNHEYTRSDEPSIARVSNSSRPWCDSVLQLLGVEGSIISVRGRVCSAICEGYVWWRFLDRGKRASDKGVERRWGRWREVRRDSGDSGHSRRQSLCSVSIWHGRRGCRDSTGRRLTMMDGGRGGRYCLLLDDGGWSSGFVQGGKKKMDELRRLRAGSTGLIAKPPGEG